MKTFGGSSTVAALVAALALTVSGCSGPDATSPPPRTSATLPAGHTWVDVPTQGVSVAAPQGWVKFTSKDTPESLAAAAKALGMTVEELKATLASQYLLQLRAPAPDPSNLNASVVDLDQVPSEGALVSQLEAAGALDVTVRPLRTAVGDALLARYRQQVGSVTVHGAGLFVDTGDELLNLTVSSPDESTVTARADVLATSIHRT